MIQERRGGAEIQENLAKEFRELAGVLLAASRARALYPPAHFRVQEALRDCYLRLRLLLQKYRRLRVVLAEEEFVVGRTQVPLKGEILVDFAEILRRVGVGRIVFSDGLLQWEMERFLKLLATDPATLDREGGVQQILAHEGVQHLTAGPLTIAEDKEYEGDNLVRAWEAYSSGVKTVRRVRQAARTRGRIEHLDETRNFAHQLADVAADDPYSLLSLHALKVHDEYSFTHSVNVAILTVVLARAMELGQYALHEITLAALLHDIGKERIPLAILNKPGKLDADERKIMERHGPEGTKMLATTPGVGDLAPIVAYEHQLAYELDNPDHGKWRLHLVSQMVCIADVYDALRSVRPYRGEMAPDVAMRIMHEEAEKKFDKDLFEGFARMVGFYPPGTCVELASGAVGVVYRSNPHDLKNPRILVLRGPGREPLKEPIDVDLANPNGHGDLGELVKVIDGDSIGIDPFDYL